MQGAFSGQWSLESSKQVSYLVPVDSGEYEQVIKRSRFIARVRPIDSVETAIQWFADVHAEFPDARHVCWAYIAGAPGSSQQSMSDAGEPSGTAGRPILNSLQHSGAGEVAAVVVRYFGGIKLGAGGLTRAYSGTASKAMNQVQLCPKVVYQTLSLRFPFADEQYLRHCLEQESGRIISIRYEEQVYARCELPATRVNRFLQKLPHRMLSQTVVNEVS